MVDAEKIAMLAAELGHDAADVQFTDMHEVGVNPARIIPAWREFVDAAVAGERPFRGIGEPVWATRSPAELAECQRHEALLNLAFAGSARWRLLCPYDTEALPPHVIADAHRSHPVIVDRAGARESPAYEGIDAVRRPFDEPLPDPPGNAMQVAFRHGPLSSVRTLVAQQADAAGFSAARGDELVLAVSEVVANSLRHGGGHGVLRVWRDGDVVICEITDDGRIDDPLAGRAQPSDEGESGRGLWIANQLCALVQLRSFVTGNVVRLHMRRS